MRWFFNLEIPMVVIVNLFNYSEHKMYHVGLFVIKDAHKSN